MKLLVQMTLFIAALSMVNLLYAKDRTTTIVKPPAANDSKRLLAGQASIAKLLIPSANGAAQNDDLAYSELTGDVGSVPLSPGIRVGRGYSRVSSNLRGEALALSAGDIYVRPENLINYRIVTIENYEQLARELKISLRAAYSGVASGKVNFFQSTKMTASKAYALVSMSVQTEIETIRNPKFDQAALQRAQMKDLSAFLNSYGDSFIYQVTRGGELYALLEFSISRTELNQTLRAKAQGGVGSFSASGSVEQSLRSLVDTKEVKITYSQTGGKTGRPTHPPPLDGSIANNDGTISNTSSTGGPIILSMKEFLGRVRDFPQEARDASTSGNSAVISGEATDYNVVGNKPAEFVIHPKLTVSNALDDIAEIRANLAAERDSMEDLLSQPSPYKPQLLGERLDYLQYIEKYLGRLTREIVAYPRLIDGDRKILIPKLEQHVSRSSDTQSQGCPLPKHGRVDDVMLCLFSRKPDENWRLPPSQLEIRVHAITKIDNFSEMRVPLKNSSGNWITGQPTRKLFGYIIQGPISHELFRNMKYAVTGAQIIGGEGVFQISDLYPTGRGFQGLDWHLAWWACADDCDLTSLRIDDVTPN